MSERSLLYFLHEALMVLEDHAPTADTPVRMTTYTHQYLVNLISSAQDAAVALRDSVGYL